MTKMHQWEKNELQNKLQERRTRKANQKLEVMV